MPYGLLQLLRSTLYCSLKHALINKDRTPPRNKLPLRTPAPLGSNHPSPRWFRKGLWIVGALAVYFFIAYGFYFYRVYSRTAEESRNLQVPEDVRDRYERIAKDYDNKVDFAEKAIWLGRLRESLAKKAYGNVLEVSVGTGRNFKYYDLKQCKSVTMVDHSGEMVKIAAAKFRGRSSSIGPGFCIDHCS